MQINPEAEIAELASRLNLKYSKFTVNVNTAVSGMGPFTYRGGNGVSRNLVMAIPEVPSASWVTTTNIYKSGANTIVSIYANGAGTITVHYLYY